MMLFVRLCLPPVAPVHDGLPARFSDEVTIGLSPWGFLVFQSQLDHGINGLIPPHSLDFSLREGLREALFGKHPRMIFALSWYLCYPCYICYTTGLVFWEVLPFTQVLIMSSPYHSDSLVPTCWRWWKREKASSWKSCFPSKLIIST